MGDFSKVYAMQPDWERDPNIERAWPKLAQHLLPVRCPNGIPWDCDEETWDAIETEARHWLGQTEWPKPPDELQRKLEMLRGGWWDADTEWANLAFVNWKAAQRTPA